MKKEPRILLLFKVPEMTHSINKKAHEITTSISAFYNTVFEIFPNFEQTKKIKNALFILFLFYYFSIYIFVY